MILDKIFGTKKKPVCLSIIKETVVIVKLIYDDVWEAEDEITGFLIDGFNIWG